VASREANKEAKAAADTEWKKMKVEYELAVQA
jgi:hypothetical protein